MGKGRQAKGVVRDARLDNLKALLIYLVVLCHLLANVATARGAVSDAVYTLINVFHMPAFVFTTGYFAKFKPRKMLFGLLGPYVVFQLLACVRSSILAGHPWWSGLTLTDPQWTLWYLLACVMWLATVPLLARVTSRRTQVGVVAGAFVVSLAAGFVPWIGRFLSLSRVVVLYPFFAAGFYAGRAGLSRRVAEMDRRTRVRLCGVLVLAVVVTQLPYVLFGPYPTYVLFRTAAYTSLGDVLMRMQVQVSALAWCGLLFFVLPGRRLGPVTTVGENTMSVYLLHTWVIWLLIAMPPVVGCEVAQLFECAGLAALVVALLGNRYVGGLFRRVLAGPRSLP